MHFKMYDKVAEEHTLKKLARDLRIFLCPISYSPPTLGTKNGIFDFFPVALNIDVRKLLSVEYQWLFMS